LKHTAIFIGGSDVAAGEQLLEEAQKHMLPDFGLRVSVLLDSSGSNTTAAAAVRAAARHLDLAKTLALVLGGTGPVGQRVALLLARQGAQVRIGSRQRERAAAACERIQRKVPGAKVEPVATASSEDMKNVADRTLVVAAGAAGAVLLPQKIRHGMRGLRVAIDLNAVPPAGIEGVEVMDKGAGRNGLLCYGAIGVGETKMKAHKAAIARLFTTNDQVLDIEEIYEIAASLP
jgi:hypothetical protein